MSKSSRKAKKARAQHHSRPRKYEAPVWGYSETPTIAIEEALHYAEREMYDRDDDYPSQAYWGRLDALVEYLVERSKNYLATNPAPQSDYIGHWIYEEIENYFATDNNHSLS